MEPVCGGRGQFRATRTRTPNSEAANPRGITQAYHVATPNPYNVYVGRHTKERTRREDDSGRDDGVHKGLGKRRDGLAGRLGLEVQVQEQRADRSNPR